MNTLATADRVVHLVDDEAAVLDALAFLLSSRGLQVHAHDSGPSFLAALDAGLPDNGQVLVARARSLPVRLALVDEVEFASFRNGTRVRLRRAS